jgi:hypothetical protein
MSQFWKTICQKGITEARNANAFSGQKSLIVDIDVGYKKEVNAEKLTA